MKKEQSKHMGANMGSEAYLGSKGINTSWENGGMGKATRKADQEGGDRDESYLLSIWL